MRTNNSMLAVIIPALLATAAAAAGPLEQARDRQDRAALTKMADEALASAAGAPDDATAQHRAALASSYLAEVDSELHDRRAAREAATRGLKPAERAVALKPGAQSYRVLGTLYGQAIGDMFSGLKYGPKAKAALDKALEQAPKSSQVYVALGVGNLYTPGAFGGGAKNAIPNFRKAIELNPKNAEAWLYLGIALRGEHNDAEARQAFTKALALNPQRVWARQQLEKTPAQ